MSPSRITSLATGAFVFVFLGVRGLAAAQFSLSGQGMAEALLTGAEARVEQGSPSRSVGVAVDSNAKNIPPFGGPRAQPPSFALREPLVRGIAASHEEKLRLTLSKVETHSIVAYSNSPIKTGDRWPTSKTRTPAVTLIADVGDAGKGLAYAQQVCSGCHHVLRTDAASPNPQAPAFTEVANTPGMSITALTVWSRTAHPTMPNLVIELADMDDLIAYILSLRDR
jgi:hypothetical protein